MRTMKRYLTRDEEARFFRVLRRHAGRDTLSQRIALRDLYLFKLLRHTGIRVGVATRITCGDAREALRTAYLLRRQDKGGRDGTTHCNRRALQALTGLLRVRRVLGCAETDDALLLVSRQAPGLTARAIQKRMSAWGAEAGIHLGISPHWWRHTKAMRVMQDSTSPDPRAVVQELFDHQSYESTMHYTRPTREDVERINEEVG